MNSDVRKGDWTSEGGFFQVVKTYFDEEGERRIVVQNAVFPDSLCDMTETFYDQGQFVKEDYQEVREAYGIRGYDWWMPTDKRIPTKAQIKNYIPSWYSN
jgi:hypothetical protein